MLPSLPKKVIASRIIGGEMEKVSKQKSKEDSRTRIVSALPSMNNNDISFFGSLLSLGFENTDFLLKASAVLPHIVNKIHMKGKVLR